MSRELLFESGWSAGGSVLGVPVTLCVAVTTADGLIMGADSMTVVRDGPLSKTYANANKVLEIQAYPLR